MSVGLSTSAMLTIDVMLEVASLCESVAMWEWQSISPGVTHLPIASIILALTGASIDLATRTNFPSRIRIEPPLMVPCETVMTLAFLIRTSRGGVNTGGGAGGFVLAGCARNSRTPAS